MSMRVHSGRCEPGNAAGRWLRLGAVWGDTRVAGVRCRWRKGRFMWPGSPGGAQGDGLGWRAHAYPPTHCHVLRPGAGSGPSGTQPH